MGSTELKRRASVLSLSVWFLTVAALLVAAPGLGLVTLARVAAVTRQHLDHARPGLGTAAARCAALAPGAEVAPLAVERLAS